MAIAMQMRMVPKLSQAPSPFLGDVIGNRREVGIEGDPGRWDKKEEKSNLRTSAGVCREAAAKRSREDRRGH